MRGVFLSLDGIDGCGKSTQGQRLGQWLEAQGHTVVSCRDPGGTALGDQLRGILLEQKQSLSPPAEALLFMASRAQLVAEIVRPALDRGDTVVSDRFLLANVVYQGYGGGLDPRQLWEAGRLSTGGLEPDLTIVLDLPISVARARRSRAPDRVESRGDDYHERVRQGFLTEARQQPGRIAVLDAAAALEAVHERIVQEVRRVLETHPRA